MIERRGHRRALDGLLRQFPMMAMALDLLGLGEMCVVHAGERSYSLASHIRAVPISRLLEEIEPLR